MGWVLMTSGKTYAVSKVSNGQFDGHFLKMAIQFNSIHAFISDKSPYYTGYINYSHRLLIIN